MRDRRHKFYHRSDGSVPETQARPDGWKVVQKLKWYGRNIDQSK